ncbi:THAP domain-containing protein 3 isoform X1 [Microcaecilia unicolor]|uniref:THAP domain-containing protein 3 isoform X1 n=1 Tax=Microcaecilia unicolor TaxID=1415580 RepID=A0A6P7WEW1_9AMPH|nr:THAP domain-containing protein 3 isoform X1 [Microcaecilia unicolor]
MPKSCAVPYCTRRYSSKNKQLTFHRFPFSKPDLFKEWVGNVGRLDFKPKQHTVICSEHFTPDCFSAIGNRKNLMPNAIPTIFPLPENVKQIERKRQSKYFKMVEAAQLENEKDLSTAESPLKEEDANAVELETVLDLEHTATETQNLTAEVATMEEEDSKPRLLQTTPPQLIETYQLSAADHSYNIVDCSTLKKKLFRALEENEKLRKRVKVKSEELRRMSANLQAVKRELETLKLRQTEAMGHDQGWGVTVQTSEP